MGIYDFLSPEQVIMKAAENLALEANEEHRLKELAWAREDAASQRWMDECARSRGLQEDLVKVRATLAETARMLRAAREWIHEVDHGHIGRTLDECRMDLCQEVVTVTVTNVTP